ncbi:MAG: peptide-methionine (S)-S-oxide reductase MsrA [Solobacterium sp.]|nr:peptide-methionine (S)-S-oxide reductase MsrA [Solobacterium sp.]
MKSITDYGLTLEPAETPSGTSWAIMSEGRCVGTADLSRDGVISVFINEADRYHHYAFDAIRILTVYAHEDLGIDTVFASMDKENEGARRILTHNGYEIMQESAGHLYLEHRKLTTVRDDDYDPGEGRQVLYFAGGCFWGMEKVFRLLDGVTDTCTGYANGHTSAPRYEDICRNDTGYRETVRVTYDPAQAPTEILLKALFLCIDPTVKDRQGEDIGTQYQTGVYYRDEELGETVRKYFEEEKKRHGRFEVELEPLKVFYEAEEYHQRYLDKMPNGYCHITNVEMEEVKKLNNR